MTTQQALIDIIQTQNASYDVVIYSKSYCPYCSKTKQLFQNYMPGSTVLVVELDKLPNGSSTQTALLTMTGQKTVPSVFVKGVHVGGNDDVHRMHQTGELEALLKQESSKLHLEDPSFFVANEIRRHQVVIWSKSYCPYCQATKTFFHNKANVDVKVHELDTMLGGAEIQKELLRLTGQRTVPNVFVNGEHLGGNDDTMQAAQSGVLDQQLLVRSN